MVHEIMEKYGERYVKRKMTTTIKRKRKRR